MNKCTKVAVLRYNYNYVSRWASPCYITKSYAVVQLCQVKDRQRPHLINITITTDLDIYYIYILYIYIYIYIYRVKLPISTLSGMLE